MNDVSRFGGWVSVFLAPLFNLKTMKKRFKIILGLCVLPLFVLAYYNDKVIMFLMPHLEQPAIQKWLRNNKAMSNTLIRLVVFWSSIGIYTFTRWLIG